MKNLLLSIFLILGISITLKSQDITILFAYTSQSACAAGGPAKIKENVDNGMRLLNEALDNNGIKQNVVVIPQYVEVEFASIPSADGVGKLLSTLKEESGAFNEIHRYRKQYKADIVCLIFSGYSMGQAYLDGEFMVTHHKTFGSSYVFPHEFGHVLGCTHKGGLGGPEGGSYFNDKDGKKRRTISANGGVAIPCFSSASKASFTFKGKQYNNVSVGDKNHDNAGTIKKNWSKKAALGENLASVAKSPQALAAKLVNPSSSKMPACQEETVTIKKCYISSDHNLNIEYEADGEVEIKATLVDAGNNSHGGFGTSLKPDGSPWSTKGRPVSTTEAGDKYVVTINDEKFNCPIGRSEVSKLKITTVKGKSNPTATKPTTEIKKPITSERVTTPVEPVALNNFKVTSFTVDHKGHITIIYTSISRDIDCNIIISIPGRQEEILSEVLSKSNTKKVIKSNINPKPGIDYRLYITEISDEVITSYRVPNEQIEPTTTNPKPTKLNNTRSTLNSGEILNNGEKLVSANGAYMAIIQKSDSHLCIYKHVNGKKGRYIWCSGVYGFKNGKLRMGQDGNLCVLDHNNRYKWGSYQDKKYALGKNYKLILTNKGKLNVVSASGRLMWSN